MPDKAPKQKYSTSNPHTSKDSSAEANVASRSASVSMESQMEALDATQESQSSTPQKKGRWGRFWDGVKTGFKTAASFFHEDSVASGLVGMRRQKSSGSKKQEPSLSTESASEEKTPSMGQTVTQKGISASGLEDSKFASVIEAAAPAVIDQSAAAIAEKKRLKEEGKEKFKREKKMAALPVQQKLHIDLADEIDSFGSAAKFNYTKMRGQTPTFDTEIPKEEAENLRSEGIDAIKAEDRQPGSLRKFFSATQVFIFGKKSFKMDNTLLANYILLKEPEAVIKRSGETIVESDNTEILLPGITKIITPPKKVQLTYDIHNQNLEGKVEGISAQINFKGVSFTVNDMEYNTATDEFKAANAEAGFDAFGNRFNATVENFIFNTAANDYTFKNATFGTIGDLELFNFITVVTPRFKITPADTHYTKELTTGGIKIKKGIEASGEDSADLVSLTGEFKLTESAGTWSGGVTNGEASLSFSGIEVAAKGINANIETRSATIDTAKADLSIGGREFSGSAEKLSFTEATGFNWTSFSLTASEVNFCDYINIVNPELTYEKSESKKTKTIEAESASLNIGGLNVEVEGGITASKTDSAANTNWGFSLPGSLCVNYGNLSFTASDLNYSSEKQRFTADSLTGRINFLGVTAQGSVMGFSAGKDGYNWKGLRADFGDVSFFGDVFTLHNLIIIKKKNLLHIRSSIDFSYAGITGNIENAFLHSNKKGEVTGRLSKLNLNSSFFDLNVERIDIKKDTVNISDLSLTAGSGKDPEEIKDSADKDEAQSLFGNAAKWIQYIGLNGFGINISKIAMRKNSPSKESSPKKPAAKQKNTDPLNISVQGISLTKKVISFNTCGFNVTIDLENQSGSLEAPEFRFPDENYEFPSFGLKVPILGCPFINAVVRLSFFGYLSMSGARVGIKKLNPASSKIDDPARWQLDGQLNLSGEAGAELFAGLSAGTDLLVSVEAGISGEGKANLDSSVNLNTQFTYLKKKFTLDEVTFKYDTSVSLIAAASAKARLRAFVILKKEFKYELAKWEAGQIHLDGSMTRKSDGSFEKPMSKEHWKFNKNSKPMLLDSPLEEIETLNAELSQLRERKASEAGSKQYQSDVNKKVKSLNSKAKKLRNDIRDKKESLTNALGSGDKLTNLIHTAKHKNRIVLINEMMNNDGSAKGIYERDERYVALAGTKGFKDKGTETKNKYLSHSESQQQEYYKKYENDLKKHSEQAYLIVRMQKELDHVETAADELNEREPSDSARRIASEETISYCLRLLEEQNNIAEEKLRDKNVSEIEYKDILTTKSQLRRMELLLRQEAERKAQGISAPEEMIDDADDEADSEDFEPELSDDNDDEADIEPDVQRYAFDDDNDNDDERDED